MQICSTLLLSRHPGDRFVGYDYASRRPLANFVAKHDKLPADGFSREPLSSGQEQAGGESLARHLQRDYSRLPGDTNNNSGDIDDTGEIVYTIPVAQIFGRQHHVDAIYHDLPSDLVYIFQGMKFYTFEASKFKVSTEQLHWGQVCLRYNIEKQHD